MTEMFPPTSPRVLLPAQPVIAAHHVWKSYRPKGRQISLRQEALGMLRQSFAGRARDPEAPFWALHDVSFTIKAGESVAILGRNGSGKTTLLRVLAGITRPTHGRATVDGRFAALIALGAGFDFQRTGRENVFLNAAIQGVHPRDAKDVLEEIIDFSELGEFIDVPVKRYSSGMITRLGFSIAAHIFPDIIFIDEVLAVGDAGFQAKCIKRISEMKAEGRTLLFVSHDPHTVQQLCERSIWLHQGQLQMDGPTEEVLRYYGALLHGDAATG